MTTERDLVLRLAAGDLTAWPELVRRHTPVVWVVARSHRLNRTDAADAVQNTWTALAAQLPRLVCPDRLRAWLVTTARRESLRILARRGEPGSSDADEPVPIVSGPEPLALSTARDRTLWLAFDALPDRCRALLALHARAPELSHGQLAAALEIGPASVGRTRGRCLEHLRRLLAEQEIREAG